MAMTESIKEMAKRHEADMINQCKDLTDRLECILLSIQSNGYVVSEPTGDVLDTILEEIGKVEQGDQET